MDSNAFYALIVDKLNQKRVVTNTKLLSQPWLLSMVERGGLEPLTSCMRSKRSPNWAIPPCLSFNTIAYFSVNNKWFLWPCRNMQKHAEITTKIYTCTILLSGSPWSVTHKQLSRKALDFGTSQSRNHRGRQGNVTKELLSWHSFYDSKYPAHFPGNLSSYRKKQWSASRIQLRNRRLR